MYTEITRELERYKLMYMELERNKVKGSETA